VPVIRTGPVEAIVLRDENKKPCDYDDTPETVAMRDGLEEYNRFLNSHWVDLMVTDEEFVRVLDRRSAGDEDEDEESWGSDYDGQYLDLTRRRLFRVFNGSFEQGGRFYGGWWQGVPGIRRPFMSIDGQPTRELDFDGMHLVMLYSEIGELLVDDPYALEGIGPEYRRLIKLTVLKMINAKEGQRIQRPMDKVWKSEEDETGRTIRRKRQKGLLLPPGMTWPELQEAVVRRHPAITCYLRSGAGIRLQRKDSDIAEAVMLSMMRRGILVLPVHDSFIVDCRHVDLLREEMTKAYLDHMGTNVRIKPDRSIVDEIGSASEEAVNGYMAQKMASDEYRDYRERGEAFRCLGVGGGIDGGLRAQAA
jgi:hypothetical protein